MIELMEDPTIHSLLNGKGNERTHNDHTRNCLRKKFKCILLWLLSIITVSQFLIIIFEKLDEKYVNKLAEKFYGLVKSNNPNATQKNF